MANSPAHKLGQLIGNFIEEKCASTLQQVCSHRHLYLDVVGHSRPARSGKKVTWEDIYGSKHDLDFVIERFGNETRLGEPVALIECAWRRYTKHSKNKAQEIQGAVLPIAAKHFMQKPFLGAIIAGDFTAPSIEQLNSCGFVTLYFPSEDVFASFESHGVNVRYDENTSDLTASTMVNNFERLSTEQKDSVWQTLQFRTNQSIEAFRSRLIATLDRRISTVLISALYGNQLVFNTVDEAILYLEQSDFSRVPHNAMLQTIYVKVEFGNNDKIEGSFSSPSAARDMLQRILSNHL
ncbi:hypothetical protein ACHELL_000103 [Vibrio vulnificus]